MNRLAPLMASLLAGLTLMSVSQTGFTMEADKLVGTWCFYEQQAVGNTVQEQVTITLNADGTYQWRDPMWHQDGDWQLEEAVLSMSMVGRHYLLDVQANHIEMERGSLMRMRRGACI